MEKDNIRHSLLSSYRMRLLASGDEEYIIIPLSSCAYVFNHNGLERMRKVLEQSNAPFIYSDYIEQGELRRLIPWQEGSLRDDFDFGKIVLVKSVEMRKAIAQMSDDFEAAGWYDLRLRLTRRNAPIYCPEPLYTIEEKTLSDGSEESHFAYVNPRNRTSQIEMEKAVTNHLKAIGGYVSIKDKTKVDITQGIFPVEASVIIPVKNRQIGRAHV